LFVIKPRSPVLLRADGLDEGWHAAKSFSSSMMFWKRGEDPVRSRIEQRVSQLEQRLSKQVAASIERLEGLSEVIERLALTATGSDERVSQIAESLKVVAADLSRELGHKVEATGAMTSSLRDSVNQDFGQIVQRLETDLIALNQKVDSTGAMTSSLRDRY
jgi:DNA anti-recombination protein RmuC